MSTEHSAPHDDCDPDDCFVAKLRYMRDNGGLRTGYGRDGKQNWKGPSIRERANRQVAEMKAAGMDPVNVGSRWI